MIHRAVLPSSQTGGALRALHPRPRFWLALGVLLASAGVQMTSCLAAAKAKAKPNVLFIAIDDLNDWISPLGGHPQSVTPNIDRLASRGVLFTNAHCAAPACNPSRAALMTGIRPSSSGVYHNSQPWRAALPEAVTLPQHFMANGYRALGSGKIYHGRFPDPPSWNAYFPSKTAQKPPDPNPAKRPVNGIPRTAHFDWGPLSAADNEMGDYKVVEWVISKLREDSAKPTFLACGIYRPHLPWYVPDKYFQRFPLESIQLPKVLSSDLADVPSAGVRMARPNGDHAKVLKHDQWEKAVQGYLAAVSFADAQLGRLLDALDDSAFARNTVIVFWTDHGWHLGEKQHWRKFSLWEEATRTPVVIVAPGIAPPGSRCERPVSLLDLYPTLIELCGLPKRPELEGVSLVPLLKEPASEWERPALTTHGKDNHAVRSSQYRYIRYADGSEELYDHHNDPQEWTNLAQRARYRTVKEKLAAWLPKKNVPEAPKASRKRNRNRAAEGI